MNIEASVQDFITLLHGKIEIKSKPAHLAHREAIYLESYEERASKEKIQKLLHSRKILNSIQEKNSYYLGASQSGKFDTQIKEKNSKDIDPKKQVQIRPDDIITPHVFLMMLSKLNRSLSMSFMARYPQCKLPFFKFLISHIHSLTSINIDICDYFSLEFLHDIDFSKFPRFLINQLRHIAWEYIFSSDIAIIQQRASDLFSFFSQFNIRLQISEIIPNSFAFEAAKRLSYNNFKALTETVKIDLYSDKYNVFIHLIQSLPEEYHIKLPCFLAIEIPRIYDENNRSVFTWICMQNKIKNSKKIESMERICTLVLREDIMDAFFTADKQGNHLLSAACELNNIEFFKDLINFIKAITGMKRHELINQPYKIFKEKVQLKSSEITFCNKYTQRLQSDLIYLPKNLLEIAISYCSQELFEFIVTKKYNSQAETRSGLNYFKLIINAKKYYLFEYLLKNEYRNESNLSSIYMLPLLTNQFINLNDFLAPISLSHFDNELFFKIFCGYFKQAIHIADNFNTLYVSVFGSRKVSGLIKYLIEKDNHDIFTKVLSPLLINKSNINHCLLYARALQLIIEKSAVKIFKTLSEFMSFKSFMNEPEKYVDREINGIEPNKLKSYYLHLGMTHKNLLVSIFEVFQLSTPSSKVMLFQKYSHLTSSASKYCGETIDKLEENLNENVEKLINMPQLLETNDLKKLNHCVLNTNLETSDKETLKLSIATVKNLQISLLKRYIELISNDSLNRSMLALMVLRLNESEPSELKILYLKMKEKIDISLSLLKRNIKFEVLYTDFIYEVCKLQLKNNIFGEKFYYSFKILHICDASYAFKLLVRMQTLSPDNKRFFKLLINFLDDSLSAIQYPSVFRKFTKNKSKQSMCIEKIFSGLIDLNNIELMPCIPKAYFMNLSLDAIKSIQNLYKEDHKDSLFSLPLKTFTQILKRTTDKDLYFYILDLALNRVFNNSTSCISYDFATLSLGILDKKSHSSYKSYLKSCSFEINSESSIVFESFRRIALEGKIFPFESRLNYNSLLKVLARLIVSKPDMKLIQDIMAISLGGLYKSKAFVNIKIKESMPSMIKVLFSLQNKNNLIEILLNSSIKDLSFFTEHIKSEKFICRLLFNLAYYHKFDSMNFLIESARPHTEVFYALAQIIVIGQNREKMETCPTTYSFLFPKEFRKISKFRSQNAVLPYPQIFYSCITIDCLKALAFFGDNNLLAIYSIIPEEETLLFIYILLQGYNRYRFNPAETTENTYDQLIKILSVRLENMEYGFCPIHEIQDFFNIPLLKVEYLWLQVLVIPLLSPSDSVLSEKLFTKIVTCNLSSEEKCELLKKMIDNGYSPLNFIKQIIAPLKYFLNRPIESYGKLKKQKKSQFYLPLKPIRSKSSNTWILRNNEFINVLITKSYDTLLAIIPQLINFIGNFEIMRMVRLASYEGVIKYGEEKDFDELLNQDPDMLLFKYNFLSIAIKNPNTKNLKRLLSYCDGNDIYEFLFMNEGKNLFDLAYHQSDEIVEAFLNNLSKNQIIELAKLKREELDVFTFRLATKGYSRKWEPFNLTFSDIVKNQYTLIMYLQQLYKAYTGDNQSYLTAKYQIEQPFPCDKTLSDFIHSSILLSKYIYKEELIRIALAFKIFPSSNYFSLLLNKHRRVDLFEIYLEQRSVDFLEKLDIPNYECHNNSQSQVSEDVMHMYFNMLAIRNSDVLLKFTLDQKIRPQILLTLFSQGHFALYLAMLFNQSNESHTENILMNLQDYISPFRQATLLFATIFVGATEINFASINLLYFKDNNYRDFKWLHYSLLNSIEISSQYLRLKNLPVTLADSILTNIFNELTEFYNYFSKIAIESGMRLVISNEIIELFNWVGGFERLILYSNLITCIYEAIKLHKIHQFGEITVTANYLNEEFNIEGLLLISINYYLENTCIKLIDTDYYYVKKIDLQVINAGLKNIANATQIIIELDEGINDLRQLKGLNHFVNYYSNIPLLVVVDIWSFNKDLKIIELDKSTPEDIVQSFSTIELPKEIRLIYSSDPNIKYSPALYTLNYTVIEQQINYKYDSFKKERRVDIIDSDFKILFIYESFLPYLIYKLRTKFESLQTNFPKRRKMSFDYQYFINKIALPISYKFNLSILDVFELQRSRFDHMILYSELFANNFLGINSLFINFTLRKFSIAKHGDLLILSFPYSINENSKLGDYLRFYTPSLDSLNEDFLVHTHTPEEIFNHIINMNAYRKVLRSDKNTYSFSFIINWESIRSYFIPYLNENQEYKKYIKLLELFNRELTVMLNFCYFHKEFLDFIWDEAMLINSLRFAADSFTIQRINHEERFYQGRTSFSKERMFYLIEGSNVKSTNRLLVDDLIGDALVYLTNTSGAIFRVPQSALPKLSPDNKSIILPEIGNILRPFPDVISISLNESDDVTLEFSNVIDSPQEIANFNLIRIKSMLQHSSTLKSYFWYVYSLQQKKVVNNKLNLKKKYKKNVFINKGLASKKLFTKKFCQWSPKFVIDWSLFKTTELPYRIGMGYANNIFDKIFEFVTAIECIFNSINSNSSFLNIQGSLHLRPKSSLMQKMIIRHIKQVNIMISNKDKLKIDSKGLCLRLCPDIKYTDSSISYESNIKLISEYVIKQEMQSFFYENLSYEDKGNGISSCEQSFENQSFKQINMNSPKQADIITPSEQSYIDVLENLELISQGPTILKFCKFVSRIYLNQNIIQVALNLSLSGNQRMIDIRRLRTGRQIFKLRFGKRFYNYCNAIELGETLCKENRVLRPLNSLFLKRSLGGFHKFIQADNNIDNEYPEYSMLDIPKCYKSLNIKIRRFEYLQGKPSSKNIMVYFFEEFPVYFTNIGIPIEYFSKGSLKYPAFCMKTQGNNFIPLFKPSNFLKLKTKPELFKKTIVFTDRKIECFVFNKEILNSIMVKTEKNDIVESKYKLEQNNTKFTGYKTYLLTFRTRLKGNYYIYCNNKLIATDFIISRASSIDPKKSTLEYNKFKDLFIVTFLNSMSEKVYLSQKGKILESQIFSIGNQNVVVNITDNNERRYPVKIITGAYNLKFSFHTNTRFDEIAVEVQINNVHINKSPYKITFSNNFKLKLNNYINEHKSYINYSEVWVITIKRRAFFSSLFQELKQQPTQMISQFVVHYEDEEGVDCSGLKRDFFECLGNYACDSKWKLFQAQGDHYRIHPEADNEALYYFGSTLANGIIHKFKVPISLCDSLIKILLELELDDSDLESQNPELYGGLCKLRSYSPADLDSLSLNFAVSCGKNQVPLCSNGENIYVNNQNLEKYIKLMIEWELVKYAKEKITNFTKGFYSVAKPLKGLFTIEEFRFIMCGFESNYLEILENSIKADNPKLNKSRAWLLKWLKEKNIEKVQKFLKFVTGSSLIPTGYENWKIELKYVISKGLPVSHSCFNRLELPCYNNYETFCENIELAIEYGSEGFGLA